MATDRLTTALGQGLDLPDGPLLLLRPPADLRLPEGQPLIVEHGLKPLHDLWVGRGARTEGEAAVALVSVPRSKTLARALVAEASERAPLVIVDGQRTDGVDPLWKAVRARVELQGTVTKAHGRLFWFTAGPDLSDWRAAPARTSSGWITAPGVFAEKGPDAASDLLAAALPEAMPGRVSDLGAGWGFLSAAVLGRAGVVTVDLIEAERAALDCARLNVTDPRARFHWADATTWRPDEPVDWVVMNPPFHQGRAGDPGLGQAFIAAAARMLTRSGTLLMVANRHLPYEATLADRFRSVTELGGTGAFKLIRASGPRR